MTLFDINITAVKIAYGKRECFVKIDFVEHFLTILELVYRVNTSRIFEQKNRSGLFRKWRIKQMPKND